MSWEKGSRRDFLGAAVAAPALGAMALADPGRAAAQAAGVERGDLPDLTIKQVKVLVLKPEERRAPANAGAPGVPSGPGGRGSGGGFAGPPGERTGEKLAVIVTNSGIEGNYTLDDRYFHPNWSNLGWLEYAKGALPGKSVLDLPALTSQWRPSLRRYGQLSYAAAVDNCCWDILGKAVGLPVYRILGAYRDRVRAYASSQHLRNVEEFVADVKHAMSDGFTAYKIHPPGGGAGGHDYKLDMEVIQAVRKTGGDDMPLLYDPVGSLTRDEAMKVGRLLDELHYVSFEDALPTKDIDGLVELAAALDVPIVMGEFMPSPYDYVPYILRGATDEVRFIVDNIGGITGGMKVARMAECFNMMCQPHNWGTLLDHVVHFHCELAMPNNIWFEMTQPMGTADRPYFKDKLRIDKDGYVPAPVKPGLGYELDRGMLDNMMLRVES
jgi:L-alanine-DL-glutamate epimerase-like enolase superfamily enzyme